MDCRGHDRLYTQCAENAARKYSGIGAIWNKAT